MVVGVAVNYLIQQLRAKFKTINRPGSVLPQTRCHKGLHHTSRVLFMKRRPTVTVLSNMDNFLEPLL